MIFLNFVKRGGSGLLLLVWLAAIAACSSGGSSGSNNNAQSPNPDTEQEQEQQEEQEKEQESPEPEPDPDPEPETDPEPDPEPESPYQSISPSFDLHNLASMPVGIAVSAANETYSIFDEQKGASRQAIVTRHFNQVTAGNIMKMSYLHPTENNFSFSDADEFVGFARSNGLTVHGHALVWHSSYQVPNFMNNYSGDFAEMLSDHVTTIVNHFDDTVVSWDVVNEAIDQGPSNGWRRSVFYNELPPQTADDIPEYIRVAFQAARNANPNIDLYYNDYDNTANNTRLAKTIEIAEALNEDGLIDGVGFQMHVYMGYPSLNNFRNAFQQVVDLGLKVKITELDIPMVNAYSPSDTLPESYGLSEAAAQKKRFCEVITTYLNTVPPAQRGGVSVWGITDDESWLMRQFEQATGKVYEDVWPLLFNEDFSAKPALQGVADAFLGNSCSA